MNSQKRHKSGFTIVEMAVTIVISLIMLLGVVGLLGNTQHAYNRMYRRVFGDVVSDAEIARIAFDNAVRKSTITYCDIGSAGDYVEVYYFAGAGSTELDSYDRFYFSSGNLMLERGALASGGFTHTGTPSVITLARNASGLFVQSGITLRMYLTIDNGEDSISVSCSSTRHNE